VAVIDAKGTEANTRDRPGTSPRARVEIGMMTDFHVSPDTLAGLAPHATRIAEGMDTSGRTY
jgi:hypothetical protein